MTVQVTSSATRSKKGRLSPVSQPAKASATSRRFSSVPTAGSVACAAGDVRPPQRGGGDAELPPGGIGDALAGAVGAGGLHELGLERGQVELLPGARDLRFEVHALLHEVQSVDGGGIGQR